jgi:hypothetical protein
MATPQTPVPSRLNKRMAELSEAAGEAASPEFKDQRGVTDTQIQNYIGVVENLMNLYTVYISALQNLQTPPVTPKRGDDSPSGAFPITYYDELREESARLQRSLETSKLALKTHVGNLQAQVIEYRKQQALSASAAETMSDPNAEDFLLMQQRLQSEAALIALAISNARMEVELSYCRTAEAAYEELMEQLRNVHENIRFTEEDLDSILSRIRETIPAREAELSKTIGELAKIGEEISKLLPQTELYSSLGQDFSQQRVALYRSAGDSPTSARRRTRLSHQQTSQEHLAIS